jgi:hypothetical protein
VITPRWVQLIRAYQRMGKGQGLGIPFLIGGSRVSHKSVVVSPDQVQAEMDALLTSFLEDAPNDYAVRVDRCGDEAKMKDEPVATLLYSPHLAGASLSSRRQGRPTLFVSPKLNYGEITSLSALSERLFDELHAHICNGRFSYRGGEYHGFNQGDLDIIDFSKQL